MPSLGNDLATIRKSRGLSLEEIHQTTKIPISVLVSIEDNSVFEGMTSNPTYIRSYVRSYAKALSIDERKIVYALNKVEKNSYSGSLIDDKQRQKFQQDRKKDTGKEEQKADAGEQKSTDSSSENPLSNSQEVHSVDWADLGHQFQTKGRTNSKWRIIFSILLLFAVGGFLIYWFYVRPLDNDAAPASGQEPPAQTTSPDSLQFDAIPSTGEDSARMTEGGASTQLDGSREALPDTLSIVLYAAYGNLEPVRVYTDILDELNPYWIENGEAIRFHFVNEFQFRDGLENVILLMNGHVVSDFRERFLNPETGRIEISRSFFEENSKWLQPPPDTLDIDVPPPSVIHQM